MFEILRTRTAPSRERPNVARHPTSGHAGATISSSGRDVRVRSALLYATLGALPFALVSALPAEVLGVWIREDGAVEWLGAIAWLLASVFFASTALIRWKAGPSTMSNASLLAGLALMSFLAAGEEISWGQRLLGYATPDVVAQFNLQKEMNIHNLTLLDTRTAVEGDQKTGLSRWLTFNRIGSLIWMGYLVALPLLVRGSRSVRGLAERMDVPVPPLAVALSGAMAYAAFSVSLASLIEGDASQRLTRVGANEVKESVVALLFLCTAYTLFRSRRRLPSHVPDRFGKAARTGSRDGLPG